MACTLFERVLIRLDRWRDAVQRERDLVAQLLLEGQSTPMLHALLDQLDVELARVTALRDRLCVERNDPSLLFPCRPKVLKVAALKPRRRHRQRRPVRMGQ